MLPSHHIKTVTLRISSGIIPAPKSLAYAEAAASSAIHMTSQGLFQGRLCHRSIYIGQLKVGLETERMRRIRTVQIAEAATHAGGAITSIL
jgi:hypothetical protein